MDDDWPTCDAEAAVAALSARYEHAFVYFTDASDFDHQPLVLA